MFHKEGYKIILITTIAIGIAFIFIDKFVLDEVWNRGISISLLFVYLFILQQFRNPKRNIQTNSEAIFSPIDGTLTSIEHNYLNASSNNFIKLTFQVSPFNFHVVRAPLTGKVITNDSSNAFSIEILGTSNDSLKTAISIESGTFSQNPVLYPEKNTEIMQGEEIGFIKFDGKVSMIIPDSINLKVEINDRVKAGEQIIAII